MSDVPAEYEINDGPKKGTFADVYIVKLKNQDEIRALKVIKEPIGEDDDGRKLWRKVQGECEVLSNLNHPNIVKLHKYGLHNHHAFIEMDFIEGITLHKHIKKEVVLKYEEVKNFIRDAVGALAFCHEKGVCHNDLHSSNIMRRSSDGAFILLDFGIAIQDENPIDPTQRNAGAIEFCPPEKFDKKTTPDFRSDVYSMGILLFLVITGQVPFMKDKDKDEIEENFKIKKLHESAGIPEMTMTKIRKGNYKKREGTTYIKDFPDELEKVVLNCLAKNPEDRYRNAIELLAALEDAMDKPIKQTAPISEGPSDDVEESNPGGNPFPLEEFPEEDRPDGPEVVLPPMTPEPPEPPNPKGGNLFKGLLLFLRLIIAACLVYGIFWLIANHGATTIPPDEDTVPTEDSRDSVINNIKSPGNPPDYDSSQEVENTEGGNDRDSVDVVPTPPTHDTIPRPKYEPRNKEVHVTPSPLVIPDNLGDALAMMVDSSIPKDSRHGKVSALRKKFFAQDAIVKALGSSDIVLDTFDIVVYLHAITSSRIARIEIVDYKIDSDGKITELKVREINRNNIEINREYHEL